MAHRLLAPALSLAAVLLCLPARADEVVLKSGRVVNGQVVDKVSNDQVVVVSVERDGDRMLVEIPRIEVHLIRRLTALEERLIAHAQQALLDSHPDKAVAFLEQLVGHRPRDPRAHRELGFALLMGGKHQEALAPLQEACALDAIDVEAHLLLAQTYQHTKRQDDAITTYRKATRIGPQHVRAWRSLARLLLIRGKGEDRNEAIDALRRASKEDPSDEETALAWAAALLPDREPQAREVLKTFLAQVPTGALAARALAKLEAMGGEFQAAGELLAKQLERKALPEGLRERLSAEASLYAWLKSKQARPAPAGAEAAELTTLPELEAAERRLAWQLELLPEDGHLHLALARVLLRAQNYAPARTFLERAALGGPAELAEDALLLQQVAVNLQRSALIPGESLPLLGKHPALKRAARLAQLAPWLEAAHRIHGEVLLKEGEYAKAAAAFRAGVASMTDPAAKTRLQEAAAKADHEAERKKRNAGT